MSEFQPIDLSLVGVTKVYPGAIALRDVELSVRGGEVVGLIGENGAGKSTLMKVLGGTIRPDHGRIVVDGRAHEALNPAQAADLGIAFVHQELNPFDNLDVAANVMLGREIVRGPLRLLDRAAMARRVKPILELLGTRFGLDDPVAGLSMADQQMLEIARALAANARLVILDEPTSSLTLSETQRLLAVVRRLREQGVAILFITHRLAEIEAVADRVVALRDGQNAGSLGQAEITRDSMVRMMVGREMSLHYDSCGHAPGPVAMELRGLRTPAWPGSPVTLNLHAGEILGLAGLVGAGRSELARVLFGVDAPAGGEMIVNGKHLPGGSIAAAIGAGVSLVPEDRKGQGLLLDFGIDQNISLPGLKRAARGPFVNRRAETELAENSRESLSIKARHLHRAVAELSGGTQQKVVLAKWLAMAPRVVIFDEPTRGIDVGARAEVYRLMRELAGAGTAVLMISSDMEEVMGVSDRVGVMCRGGLADILPRERVNEEEILRLAVG